jgi:hypothetical protein
MKSDHDFRAAYQDLEARMDALAEEDGDVFLPNPQPEAPVQYAFICMEPSLGGRSPQEARARVEAGARNFLNSVEDFILHFCATRYLCDSEEKYHITDISKGAMPVSHAEANRWKRYDRWYSLLQEEIDLVATSDAHCFAVGKSVDAFLTKRNFQWPFTYLLHYSPQAARARNKGIEGHEEDFEAFRKTVSLEDVVAVAEQVLEASSVPPRFQDEALSRLEERGLSPSRKKLIFNYKLAFEAK